MTVAPPMYWVLGASLIGAGGVPFLVPHASSETVEVDFRSVVPTLMGRRWGLCGISLTRFGSVSAGSGAIESIMAGSTRCAPGSGWNGIRDGGDDLGICGLTFLTPFRAEELDIWAPLPPDWGGFLRCRWRNYSGTSIQAIVALAISPEDA